MISKAEYISENTLRQCRVIQELYAHLKKIRPEMQSGLFCTSNKDAFAISEDVITGRLTELLPNGVESLNLAYEDILRISESDLESVENLAELDLPIDELLEFIDDYDQRAIQWSYSLEDMRRPEFIGIFCAECDQEIGGELDCPDCIEEE